MFIDAIVADFCRVIGAGSSDGSIDLYRLPVYNKQNHTEQAVITDFRCTETRRLFTTGQCKRWQDIQRVAERKLAQLDAAVTLDFLRSPPGNRLEKLSGDRDGQYSIRINGQWRICFVWTDQGASQVEIVDYH